MRSVRRKPARCALTIRRLHTNPDNFRVAYEHPLVGRPHVGSISERSGAPNDAPKWEWYIGINLPGWIGGSATSYEEAAATWKERWPAWRDVVPLEDWRTAKEHEDCSNKKDDIWYAEKLARDQAELVALQAAKSLLGPTPDWIVEILRRSRAADAARRSRSRYRARRGLPRQAAQV